MPPSHYGFRIGDVFSPGDSLGEWVATIAMATNDNAFAGSIVFGDTGPGEQSYAARLVVAHFYEIGSFLDTTVDVPEVANFVATLTDDVVGDYSLILETYRAHRSQLAAIRSNGVFHYPKWGARRNITKALRESGGSLGIIRVAESIKEHRYVFADEIASALLHETCPGGHKQLLITLKATSDALGSFATFGDAVVNRYLTDRSVDLTEFELSSDGVEWLRTSPE
jgi:hypothetical protein